MQIGQVVQPLEEAPHASVYSLGQTYNLLVLKEVTNHLKVWFRARISIHEQCNDRAHMDHIPTAWNCIPIIKLPKLFSDNMKDNMSVDVNKFSVLCHNEIYWVRLSFLFVKRLLSDLSLHIMFQLTIN